VCSCQGRSTTSRDIAGGSWQPAEARASREAVAGEPRWRRRRVAGRNLRFAVSSTLSNLSGPRPTNPNTATFLTWFLPGAGHMYAGHFGLGLLVCALVEGLYFAGLQLSQGMTFQYLDPELRGRFATALSPEVGNLGGLLWQMQHYGFGELRPWPEHVRLGSWLAAISGMTNVVAMCHAHLLARTNKPRASSNPALAVALTWVCPGAGGCAERSSPRC
jgi:hypothetical protein